MRLGRGLLREGRLPSARGRVRRCWVKVLCKQRGDRVCRQSINRTWTRYLDLQAGKNTFYCSIGEGSPSNNTLYLVRAHLLPYVAFTPSEFNVLNMLHPWQCSVTGRTQPCVTWFRVEAGGLELEDHKVLCRPNPSIILCSEPLESILPLHVELKLYRVWLQFQTRGCSQNQVSLIWDKFPALEVTNSPCK